MNVTVFGATGGVGPHGPLGRSIRNTKPDARRGCCIRDTPRSPGTHRAPGRVPTGRARQTKGPGTRDLFECPR
jgi:hypothetical protein